MNPPRLLFPGPGPGFSTGFPFCSTAFEEVEALGKAVFEPGLADPQSTVLTVTPSWPKTRTTKFFFRSKSNSISKPSSNPKFFLISEGIEILPFESIFTFLFRSLELGLSLGMNYITSERTTFSFYSPLGYLTYLLITYLNIPWDESIDVR